jgi:hypothetical protein
VGERQRIIAYSVMGHQEPARQASVDPGQRVADCCLSRLHSEHLHELQQRVAERLACPGRLA